PNPRNVGDIAIPAALRTTTRNENFLLWDSGNDDPNRILMFGTVENLRLLQQHRHWFVDGTFKVSPEIFYQVFTIHGLIDNSTFSLVYILLQHKREEINVRIFQKNLELQEHIRPSPVYYVTSKRQFKMLFHKYYPVFKRVDVYSIW
ncbi:unnamed protein product, partial [Psylliodes chrysocephalus]